MYRTVIRGQHGRMAEEEHASSQGPGARAPGEGGGGAAAGDRPDGGATADGAAAHGAAAHGAAAEGAATDGPLPGGASGGSAGPPSRRLTRSRRPRVAGGVCAGLGRYFDLDPVIFRVPLAVLSVAGGLGLVFYGFAWLLIPAEGEQQNEARWLLSGRVEGSTLSAILVALVGCGLFLASLGNRSTPYSLLIAGAVTGAAYWSHHRREAEAAEAVGAPVDPATAHAVADAPPEAQAPPVPGTPSWWREPLTKDGTAARDTGYLWGPDEAAEPRTGARPAGGRPRRTGEHVCGGRRERSLGGLVATLASAAAVVGTFSGWESRPLGTNLTLGLACALAVYAIGFVVSAFAGRVGFGTVFLVVVTAVMLAGASLIPKSIGTDWREVTWTPASAPDVRGTYRLDAGSGELDLRDVRFAADGGPVRTTVRAGAGMLKVVVPRDTQVELDAGVGAGEIRLPRGLTRDGEARIDSYAGLEQRESMTLPPFDGRKPRGTLKLSVHMDVGQFEIVRALPAGERSDRLPPAEEFQDDRRAGAGVRAGSEGER